MGLTMGIVAAPCIGPFVARAPHLRRRDGQTAPRILSCSSRSPGGSGVPFLVLGTLSGSISRLPRSGDWMVWVRKIFGFILIAMALYFVRHLLGPRLVAIGYAVIAIAGGIYLGWIDRAAGAGRGFKVAEARSSASRGSRSARRFSSCPRCAAARARSRGASRGSRSARRSLASAARDGKTGRHRFLGGVVPPLPRARQEDLLRSGGREALRRIRPAAGSTSRNRARPRTKIKNDYRRSRASDYHLHRQDRERDRRSSGARASSRRGEFMKRVEALRRRAGAER